LLTLTFNTRWDKLNPGSFNPDNVNWNNVNLFLSDFMAEKSFLDEISFDVNFGKYLSYFRRGKYNKLKVQQGLIRVLNVYRKRYQRTEIVNLDELQAAAVDLEHEIMIDIMHLTQPNALV
jgi:hypothetical protein